MRIFAIALTGVIIASTLTAQAEKRLFIVDDNGDATLGGCPTTRAGCRSAAATAFCQGRNFHQAASYRKVDRDDVTGAVPTKSSNCHGRGCGDFLAIECTR